MKHKGFSLIELVIVIAILAIIMLIGTVAYGGIQERARVRADKATAAQIGRALSVREVDLESDNGIKFYPELTIYDDLANVENYVDKDIRPQSMEDGYFIVTAIQTEHGKKIIVGIGKPDDEFKHKVYKKGNKAGWAWAEDSEISEFIKENKDKFTGEENISGGGSEDEGTENGGANDETEYTLTVDPNGGTWSDGTNGIKMFAGAEGSTLIIPEILPKQGTIQGRFEANGGTFNGESSIIVECPFTEVEFSSPAIGSLKDGVYTFGADNASIKAKHNAYLYPSQATTVPTREGYTFRFWGGLPNSRSEVVNVKTASGVLRIYAIWKANS